MKYTRKDRIEKERMIAFYKQAISYLDESQLSNIISVINPFLSIMSGETTSSSIVNPHYS